MKLPSAAVSCRQLRRVLLTSNRTPYAHPSGPWMSSKLKPSIQTHLSTFTKGQIFQGFDHKPDAEPVVDGLALEDIVHDDGLFKEKPLEIRIMSPREEPQSHYTSISAVEEDYDQDYDEYNLHMTSFQAYNCTRESLPDLDMVQHEDVQNLEDVKNDWESHPNTFSSDDLSLDIASDEYVPDVEDI